MRPTIRHALVAGVCVISGCAGTSRGSKRRASCCFPRSPLASSRYSTRLILKCWRMACRCGGCHVTPAARTTACPPHSPFHSHQVHRWLDKSFLVSLAARACGFTLLFRKVVPFSRSFGSKSIKFGRPSYSHVLCFAKDGSCSVSKGAWPDVSARGSLV